MNSSFWHQILFGLMSEYLDIRLILEKCFHNSFVVKYHILAHHFAVSIIMFTTATNFLKLSIQYSIQL